MLGIIDYYQELHLTLMRSSFNFLSKFTIKRKEKTIKEFDFIKSNTALITITL